MNTASRIESGNKQLKAGMMASREAVERSDLDWWRPMGRVVLRGRAKPVEIFEPVPDMDASDLGHFRSMMNRLSQGDMAALDELEAFASSHRDDAALGNLVYRLKHAEPGGHYVLD